MMEEAKLLFSFGIITSRLYTIIFILIHSSSQFPVAAGASAESEEVSILIEFKRSLIDSDGNLHNWVASDYSPCEWKGVACTNNAVTALDFSNFNLNGTISAAISKLRNLQYLNLTFNNFDKEFPYGLLGCSSLIELNLSQNYFSGPLPSNISLLATSLTVLDLSGNPFEGSIPDDFWKLRNLRSLNLVGSSLSGTVTSHIGRLSNLTWLDLGWNPFSPAAIPSEIGNLTELQVLNMANCSFTSNIPSSIGALKQLVHLDLTGNNLNGSIPSELMQLPRLKDLYLYDNSLSGPLPPGLVNLTLLTNLDLSVNLLSGSIPREISQLTQLTVFELYHNRLEGSLPDGLADLPKLQVLNLYGNSFNESIPPLMGKNSPLMQFDVAENLLTGPMPAHLCDGGKLQNLSLLQNMLEGEIPDSYGTCPSLIRVQLHGNHLRGVVPAGLWGSPAMTVLNMADNELNGSISSAVGGASQLAYLILDNNQFSGDLPHQLGQLPRLTEFSAISNKLWGSIPFGNCSALLSISLAFNSLSGQLPAEIANCKQVNYIDLADNELSGTIPASLARLPHLNYLNLSVNHLEGTIPPELGATSFLSFNVSYNNLQGAVPGNLGITMPASSFAGNSGLCGNGLARACMLPSKESGRRGSGQRVRIVMGAIAAAASLTIIAVFILYRCWHRERPKRAPLWKITSFQKLSFNEELVANSIREENLIGSGGSGKVYKVDLLNGQSVAVKKLLSSPQKKAQLWTPDRSSEVETLSLIRHRNIVRILCCCSSDDAELLVFEYMCNGSLGDVLHGKRAVPLDWHTRYKIAVGAAEGLSYLHHDCHPAILHRDIKSNNILLTSDFEAKLADFGLAKPQAQGERGNTITGVAGSYGYIAPEYAYTLKVDEKSDIYSYGVVLLELITGRRPIEAEFGEGTDLVRWVRSKIHVRGGVMSLVDPQIRCSSDCSEMSMYMCLQLAMRCTSSSPALRPSMRDVVEMLQQIKPINLRSRSWDHNFSLMRNKDITTHHFLHRLDYLL